MFGAYRLIIQFSPVIGPLLQTVSESQTMLPPGCVPALRQRVCAADSLSVWWAWYLAMGLRLVLDALRLLEHDRKLETS